MKKEPVMKNSALSPVSTLRITTLSCDVSSEKLNFACPDLGRPGFRPEWEIANTSDPIRATLRDVLELAREGGYEQLRVVVEPTGVYHHLLLRIAREMKLQTGLVNGAHVAKMREILCGDPGKTDERDPRAIHAVAERGRLILDRELPEVYELLRHRSKLFEDAEVALIDAKSRIHRAMKLFFPDFSFKTDFLYGDSGKAIFQCYGLNPLRIVRDKPSRIYERLRRHSKIKRSSVERLLANARSSSGSIESGRRNELLAYSLGLAWADLETATARRECERKAIEELYDEARLADPKLPDAEPGVISKLALARLFAETGPLKDFDSWRQVLKMGGMNLCERKSGKYVGQTKISRSGRVRARTVLNHIVLPLVKRKGLYGQYYHHKTEVEKMTGKKAMTAVSRKFVKLLWGWYHSGAAFDRSRVFACESAHRMVA